MNAFSGGLFFVFGFVYFVLYVFESVMEVCIGMVKEYFFVMVMVMLGFFIAFFVERVVFYTYSYVTESEGDGEYGYGYGYGYG